MNWRVAILFCALGLGACEEGLGPTMPLSRVDWPAIPVTSVVYVREHPFDPAVRRPLSVNIRFPASRFDPHHRSALGQCELRQITVERFECSPAFWACEVYRECALSVSDPALIMELPFPVTATAVFVNGQRLQRVERYANGAESGLVRFNARGELY